MMTLHERADVLSRCSWRRANCRTRRQERQQNAISALNKASIRAERLRHPHVPEFESSFEIIDGSVRKLPSSGPARWELAKRSARLVQP